MKPLADRVVLRGIDEDKTTDSGLIIPDHVNNVPHVEGEVIAVGRGSYQGERLIEPEVSVGDRVVYNKFGGTNAELDGEEVIILRESDILAIL